MNQKLILATAFVIGAVLTFVLVVYLPQLPVATGYAAKKMCSCTFISGRTQQSIQDDDLGFSPLGLTSTRIDRDEQVVVSSMFGLARQTAVYRGDVGCVLLHGDDDYNVALRQHKPIETEAEWPLGNHVQYASPAEVDVDALDEAIASYFDTSMEMDTVKTRAVLVVHKGKIVAEQYAKSFTPETEILGWSMTKSITSAMIGIMVRNGQMSLDDSALFPEWTDQRSTITLKDLLQMQSGLEFEEEYGKLADATRMLYKSENSADIPMQKPLVHDPGTTWYYSSGTTNLLQHHLRNTLGDQYLKFAYDSLFFPLGMLSAVLETDESGLYIGSSYCYATPRDWAKFGLLFLNNGNWFGKQIVDSSWVDFVRQPASNSNGMYGGQFWLNMDGSNYPDAPHDVFMCNGFQGQHVFIIPSKDLVIVRMGLTGDPEFNANDFLRDVTRLFPDSTR